MWQEAAKLPEGLRGHCPAFHENEANVLSCNHWGNTTQCLHSCYCISIHFWVILTHLISTFLKIWDNSINAPLKMFHSIFFTNIWKPHKSYPSGCKTKCPRKFKVEIPWRIYFSTSIIKLLQRFTSPPESFPGNITKSIYNIWVKRIQGNQNISPLFWVWLLFSVSRFWLQKWLLFFLLLFLLLFPALFLTSEKFLTLVLVLMPKGIYLQIRII